MHVRYITGLTALVVAALSGCATELSPQSFADRSPTMTPEIFFAGSTESSGVVESSAGRPVRRFRVKGLGTTLPDGAFRLVQTVSFEHEPPQIRTWRLERLDPHHYSATLTDASGPVDAEAYGDLLHIRYPMKTPIGGHMEQWLYLQPDGRSVMNEGTVRILGIVVAHLSERITHREE